MAPNASSLVFVSMVVLPVTLLLGWVSLLARAATGESDRTFVLTRFTVLLAGWSAVWLLLAASGVLAAHLQLVGVLVVSLMLGAVMLTRSRAGQLLQRTPLWLLVGMQAFRFPLELVMHQAATEGVMPVQMTFGVGGLNYDIVSGATAVLLGAVLCVREVPRAVVLAWNVLGSLLLLNIVTVAVLSTPILARFGRAPHQLNTWVLFAPYVWLPAVLVGSALLGHLLIFRKLALQSKVL